MMEFFASTYFLGLLILTGGCVFFLCVFFPSWFDGYPRRFWITRLTYKDDEDQQSLVRFLWIMAWLLSAIGSIIATCNHPHIQFDFWWGTAQVLYCIFLAWLIAKAVLAICIAFRYIGLGFIRLKQWIFNDKPLFSKHEKLKPLESER